MSREKLISLPPKNASTRSASPSISAHVEGIESGNDFLTNWLAESPGVESNTRQIFGSPSWTDQSRATGPKGLGQKQKDVRDVLNPFMRFTNARVELLKWKRENPSLFPPHFN